MKIETLISLAEAKLRHLSQDKLEFERIGDVDSIVRIEDEIVETEETLRTLKQQ